MTRMQQLLRQKKRIETRRFQMMIQRWLVSATSTKHRETSVESPDHVPSSMVSFESSFGSYLLSVSPRPPQSTLFKRPYHGRHHTSASLRCYSSSSKGYTEASTPPTSIDLPNSIHKLQLSRTHQDWKDLALYFTHQLPDPTQDNNNNKNNTELLLSMDQLHEWVDTIRYWIQSASSIAGTTIDPSLSPSSSALHASRESIQLASHALKRLANDLHAYPQPVVDELLLGTIPNSDNEEDNDNGMFEEEDDHGNPVSTNESTIEQDQHSNSAINPMLLKRLLNQILQASRLMVIANHPPDKHQNENTEISDDSKRNNDDRLLFQTINRETHLDMFELVKDCCRLGVNVYPHAFQRIMDTAFSAAENEPHLQQDLPVFCEQVLAFMLSDDEMDKAAKLLIPGMPGDRVPRLKHFTLIMKAWASSGRKDRIVRGIRILNAMEALLESGMVPPDHKPDVVLYNTLLELLRSGNADDFRHAERVFVQMDQGAYEGVVPDAVTYRIMFYGFAELIDEKNPNPDAVDQAIAFLRKMEVAEEQMSAMSIGQEKESYAEHSVVQSPQLDSSMYAFLIQKLTHAGLFEKAEQVLSSLKQTSAKMDPIADNFYSNHPQVHKALVFLYSKTSRPEQAQDKLMALENDWDNRMSQTNYNHSDSQDAIAPKRSHYESVLEAWVATRNFEKIQSWINHLAFLAQTKDAAHLLPRRKCVTNLLKSYSKSPHDADQLFRMFAKLDEEADGAERIVGREAYDRMIQMWGDHGDPKQAEIYLNELCAIYEETEDPLVRPGPSHFTAVIQAWARSKPKSPSEREEASSRMHAIWDRVYKPYSQGSKVCIPDSYLYASILNACARTKNVSKMEEIASFMVEDFLKGNKKAQPNVQMLITMLIGVLKSKRPNYALGTHLLQLMQKAGVKPNSKCEKLMSELRQYRN